MSFHTLGCKVNFAETSTLAREFVAAGFERVGTGDDESGEGEGEEADGSDEGGWSEGGDGAEGGGSKIPVADVYVVNTCSVTAAADKKCRNLIARLHRRSPEARIIVTGCYAQLAPERLAAIEGVAAVFGNNFKGDISGAAAKSTAERLRAVSPSRSLRAPYGRSNPTLFADAATCAKPSAIEPDRIAEARSRKEEPTCAEPSAMAKPTSDSEQPETGRLIHCGHSEIGRFYPAFSAGDRTRSFLKVQDGCDYKCSYCTIHYARGGSRNASIAEVMRQAREIAARGVREIVITGVNTGDFGRTTGESFIDLVRALDTVEGIERYRISSIEPNLLTDEIIDFCAASRTFQPHFHIPLQSGSDRILGLMRRRYTSARFADRVARVREAMPDAFIGVDVIVGFPGETEADFEQTRAFLERVRPSQLHVFPYSVRPGTPAAEMPGRVAPEVTAERAAALGELSETLLREFTARFAGTQAEVLWEADRRGGMMSGFTGNYLKVTAPYDPMLVNTITNILV